jgi:hypothetical protein
MIELQFDPRLQLLLVRFAEAISDASLDALDAKLARFVDRHGPVDMIVDYSTTPRVPADAAFVRRRAGRASRMQGRRRVFVAPRDTLFGMLRMFGAYQSTNHAGPAEVVRTLQEAFDFFGVSGPRFEPVDPGGL